MPTTAESPRAGRNREAGLRHVLSEVETFGEAVLGTPLRAYQLEVARAVVSSIAARRGHPVQRGDGPRALAMRRSRRRHGAEPEAARGVPFRCAVTR